MAWVTVKCKYCNNLVTFMGSWDMPLDVVCKDYSAKRSSSCGGTDDNNKRY